MEMILDVTLKKKFKIWILTTMSNIGVGSPKAINNTYYCVKLLNRIGNNLEHGEHLQQNVSIENMLGESMKSKATHGVDNFLKLSYLFF